MRSLPAPNWLRTFEASARLGGFTAAGAALGLTPAAVSQQIRALEMHLGFRLFDRLPRGVALTEVGRAYLPSVQRAFEDLEASTTGLFGLGRQSSVTFRGPISFTALCLAPVLNDFKQKYPSISVRFCTALWADAVDDSTIDLDVRYGDGSWSAAEKVRLTAPVSILVCPPGAAASADPIETLRREANRAIHVTGYEALWANLGRQHALDDLAIGGTLSADSSLIALEMVSGGLGSAIIARDLAHRHIAAGLVAAPAGFELRHTNAHYLLRPQRSADTPPEALLFRNWLLEQSFDTTDVKSR